MKKLFSVLLFLFVFSFCFAEEYVIGSVVGRDTTYHSPRNVHFKYDDTNKTYYLQIETPLYLSWSYISDKQLQSLQKTIDKAVEWGNIVETKKVAVTKSLPDSQIDTKVSWRFINDANNFYSSNSFTLFWDFIGAEDGDWVLLFYSSEAKSRQNQFMTYSTDFIYFTKDSVLELQKIISDENIQKEKAKNAMKQSLSDDLFK